MPSNPSEEPPHKTTNDDPYRRVDEVTKIVTTQMNRAYDMKRLIKVLVDDDIIDPRDTRKFLCQALEYSCMKYGTKSQRLLANWPTGY